MNKLVIIFSGVRKDFSMQAMMMSEGCETDSNNPNQRSEEEIPGLSCTVLPLTHSLATILTKDVGSTLKGSIPLPLPSSSSSSLATAHCLFSSACPSKEGGEGSRSDRQDKRVGKGPSGNSAHWGHVVQGGPFGWVT